MRARRGNETVKFRHLVQFIKEEAKKANHPVYGREALVKQKNNPGGKLLCATGSKLKSSAAACQSDVPTETKAPVKNDKAFNRDRRNVQDGKSDLSKSCLYCQSSTHVLDKCNRITVLSSRDRYDFMRSKGLCFGCLRFGHMKSSCRNKASCTYCGGRHPTILHVDGKADAKDDISKSSDDTNEKPVNLCGHIGAGDGDCAMAIIPIRVKMKNKMNSVVAYAFFDSGSSVSFCSDRLLRQVGGHGKPMRMLLNTMGEPYSMDTCAVTGLQVCSLDSNNLIDMPCVYTKDAMPVTRHHIPSQRDIERWPHLQDMKLPELNAEIGLMIGNNVPDAYAPLEIMMGPRGSPHATRTLLGWIIWNVVRPNDNCTQEETATNVIVNRAQVVAIHKAESLQQLDRTLRDSINRDFPERLSEDKREMSSEDKKFLEQCESSVQLVDNHYCMKLPFRNIDIRMPNNQSQALERLTSLKRKLTKNSQFCEDYTGFMNKIMDCGYAETVPDEDLDRDDGRVWYIPHHGVYHPKKPDKIRVVFDCTTSFRGVSLNSQLLPGPDLTNSLLRVLLRFRQGKVVVMGDVESMFYQVRVSEEDVDCLRFFWWPDGNLSQEPVPYRMRAHLFGAVSSPACSNFALQRTALDNANQYDPVIVATVHRNMYGDDYLASAETETEAASLIKGASDLCARGGFHLTKWVATSRDVLESVPVDERANDVKQLDLECGSLPSERALGIYCFTESDSLGFKIQVKHQPFTRRGILSVVSSVYDPMGLAAPFVLNGKILLQSLCKRDLHWDEPITGTDTCRWKEWLTELPNLESLLIPRCYKPKDFGTVVSSQMHTFSDASKRGYGMVSYLRLIDENNRIHCSFVMGKARVAPLKKITIPRMGLTAASIAVRIASTITKELDYTVNESFFWTDSMSTLRYIANENTRFHTFVANRVAIIRDATRLDQWRYIESSTNPADCASRGLSMNKFLSYQQWLNGPDFLWKDEVEWPQDSDSSKIIKVQRVINTAVLENSAQATRNDLFSHFSDWTKLRKTVAWMLMAIETLQSRVSFRKEVANRIELCEQDPAKRAQRVESAMSIDNHKRLKEAKDLVKSV